MNHDCAIIHIDDNVSDLQLTQLALEEAQIEVKYEGISNPLLALAVLDQPSTQKHRLIVLDVNMPGLTGIELLRQLSERHRLDGATVVMLTTSARAEDEKHCLALGARAYLVKPNRFQDLVALMHQLINYC